MSALAILETHPVQYHAPVWRRAAESEGVPLHVIYGGDFSVRGYEDREFGTSFQWEADLLAGYSHEVLQPASADYESVTAVGVEAALDRMKPAAVLALGYHHPLDRAALSWAMKRKIPLLFRGETSDAPHSKRRWWRALLRDVMLRRLYRHCSACLYLGERSLQHYKRLGVEEERLIHSPYCVDTSAFQVDDAARDALRPLTRKQAGIADDAWVVLFSGKLSRRKGVHLLLETLKSLPEDLRRRVHLVYVGSGEQRQELEAAFAHAPDLRCHFAGFVNQSGLSAWYHAADVLVLPSLELETWGLVVNDALHHGVPAVVSDAVGCAPDLIASWRTGEVCQAGNAGALAYALERCASWSVQDPAATRRHCRELAGRYTITQAAAGVREAWLMTGGRVPSRE
ncbi:MAG: glycosyltransferase [Verrucomicrobiota bacterium]